MRYEMRRSLSPLLALFGGTREKSFVSLVDEGVRFKFGAFDESFALDEVASVERTTVPWIAGVGWKLGIDTIALLGSQQGVVRVVLRDSKRMRFFGFPYRARNLLVSLEEPDAFIADLRGKIEAATRA